MSKIRRVAVIAGTSVDTRMGVEYLNNKNAEAGCQICEPIYMPVTEDCDAQLRFQYSDEDGKRTVIDRLFSEIITDGVRDFFIYCNSLSGAFDFDSYAIHKSMETDADVFIYTPLQVYREIGRSFKRVGVMAANSLSSHAIEETLMSVNPDIYMIGMGNMAIVRAIEDGLEPEEIVEKFRLGDLAAHMEACGAEALILGCTHFPYFKEELAKRTKLTIIDPAERMLEMMLQN